MARYLNLAMQLGLSRKDALLMEIKTVYEMHDMRSVKKEEANSADT